ncbi:transcription-repair coupling factor [Anaerovibrio sp.]|uniref:transcription-repair coupling factor n=1 Tax=Anaerovibrio sp. TaxID=1872532 RepID=UPI0025C664FF|nr:transcription-repair coupling factor [Anaerovibrio sp.]MBR2142705.1 transcription-repair coupling factor [Anaerovibrio sp.]
MHNLLSVMLKDSSIKQMSICYNREKGQAFVYGLSGTQKHASFSACYAEKPKVTMIVTYEAEELAKWREDLSALLPEAEVVELPVLDMVDFTVDAKGIARNSQRMEILGRILKGEALIVLTTAQAAVQKGISPKQFRALSLTLAVGDVIERNDLLEHLVKIGYERTNQVEVQGEFCIRGGIVDIFPVNTHRPYRIEFFDDEVDSIRFFDVDSQTSVDKADRAEILPFDVFDDKHRKSVITEFLPKESVVVMDAPLKLRDEITKLSKENPDIKERLFSWEDFLGKINNGNVIYMAMMLHSFHGITIDHMIGVSVQGMASYQRQFDMLTADMEDWLKDDNRVLVTLGAGGKVASLREMLARRRLASVEGDRNTGLREGMATLVEGTLLNGFELPNAKLVVITEKDIFGRQKKRLARVSREERITHFREINVGDYVVHVQYGIGKYCGVETKEIDGIKRDYLYIQYGGEDKLFVPTDQVGLLQKYIGKEGEVPRLHKIGSSSWSRTKSKVQSSVKDIARELIQLYAKRSQATGYAFSRDTVWQQEFEEAFPYEETPDQLTAVAEIKADMEKNRPMDRLLCGDIGFGKTEVAMRAAFKAVMDGKQVAVLVPTTVLAQQHYKTFGERFNNFGPTVEVINRFRSSREQKEILARVEDGRTDILIGTHAILNTKKVKFKDLGLLVVDEEQRFGVAQKEKIKSLSTGIDVLTLSATPIPRTLHMSLSGARDMSIMETAPRERFPVQTYVAEENDNIIRNAIRRELKRGGQVYFVYNRVETIYAMQARLERLVPEASIRVGHGQMPEAQLERVMVEFYEDEFDVLLSTTIIENGLDVANANTMIVYDADRFGLAQLYQMRGRVGRSKNLAYAYLLYKQDKVLNEVAEKRLQAVKEFAELGAGFKIAMRDLEIRGAGNLLGAKQHGHIASVGFEMYCQMLDDAVQELKTGRPVEHKAEPLIEFKVEAYISSDYVGNAMNKIEIYQRIAAIRSNDSLNRLIDELIDRFGDPPQPVLNLLTVAKIRNISREIGIKRIAEGSQNMEFYFDGEPRCPVENLMALTKKYGSKVKFDNVHKAVYIDLSIVPRATMHDFVLENVELIRGIS